MKAKVYLYTRNAGQILKKKETHVSFQQEESQLIKVLQSFIFCCTPNSHDHCGRSCISSQYSCIARRYWCLTESYESWEASQKVVHREMILYLAEIYESREDLIPYRNLCITTRFLYLEEIMHQDKIFMPHRILCITGRYSYPAKNHASREDIHSPQDILHFKRRNSASHGNIYPSTSTASLFGKSKCQENHRKQLRKYRYCISFIYFDIQWKVHWRLYGKHKT